MFRENDSLQIISSTDNLWGIVLAGGEGTRLKNLVKRLYGYHRPKQYCTITGTSSLIEQTINRALRIIPDKNILTVVNSSHSKYYKEELKNRPEETIVVQPCPRDTSAGIFLPVAKIHKSNPDSTVAIFPSDHFILEEYQFISQVREAFKFVEVNPDLIIIIGIRPDRIESGLGWIEKGRKIQSTGNLRIHRVQKFWEKPDLALTSSIFKNGCLINTFIIIGKSKTIIHQIKSQLPQLYNAFSAIIKSIGTEYEKQIIEQFFKFIPAVNFSKSVLEKISSRLAVLEIPNVYWSDWGEEQRVASDMQRFNLSFSHKLINNGGVSYSSVVHE